MRTESGKEEREGERKERAREERESEGERERGREEREREGERERQRETFFARSPVSSLFKPGDIHRLFSNLGEINRL